MLCGISRPARADDWCAIGLAGGGLYDVFAGPVDLGFTINAAVATRDPLGHPNSDIAKIQLGLMVPQVVFSAAFMGMGLGLCADSNHFGVRESLLMFGIPLVWSLGLMVHGAWSLHAGDVSQTLTPVALGLSISGRY